MQRRKAFHPSDVRWQSWLFHCNFSEHYYFRASGYVLMQDVCDSLSWWSLIIKLASWRSRSNPASNTFLWASKNKMELVSVSILKHSNLVLTEPNNSYIWGQHIARSQAAKTQPQSVKCWLPQHLQCHYWVVFSLWDAMCWNIWRA